MSDLALYRKYRSGSFADVIGQDHVVRTLTSALANDRLRHAYLFTGPRGVGKTSVARLLARALNCTGEPKPCNKCDNCLTALNSSLDIVEMDAASNRSIDAIRDMREKVSLAPTSGRFKVYIIDEVHMLTTEAFNALLKTLEEPPSHVVFILATTESHKLPETIVSRTQAFAFKPITASDISAQLSMIAKSEKLEFEPEALTLIATAARGGFRDAISLLDQLGGQGAVNAAQVRELLGYTGAEEIAALSRALVAGDAAAALTVTQRLETSGAQASNVILQLSQLWRSVLLTVTGAAPASDALTGELAAGVTPYRAADIIAALAETGRSAWPQLALEAALVKLTSASDAALTTSPAPAAPSKSQTRGGEPETRRPEPQTRNTEPSPAPASAPAPATAAPSGQLWPKVIVQVKNKNNNLSTLLQMYPVDFADGEVTIKPRFDFHRDLLLKPLNRTIIETAVAGVYGKGIKVSVRTHDTGKTNRRGKSNNTAELVSSALEILGGEVID